MFSLQTGSLIIDFNYMPSYIYNKVLRKFSAYANFDRVIFALIFAKLFTDYQEWECIETLHIVTVEYVFRYS